MGPRRCDKADEEVRLGKLDGRVAIVTGGGRGIGRAAAAAIVAVAYSADDRPKVEVLHWDRW